MKRSSGYLRDTQQLQLLISVLIPHAIRQTAITNPLPLLLPLPANKEREGHAGLELACSAISHAAYAGIQIEARHFRNLQTSLHMVQFLKISHDHDIPG